ncbi:ABC transporter substrate-binding protein [Vineibacter terrae]|uniref:ABC transporter substrate-binding protein n=1 Tax=Vineibacter terrae TaxID=2586908 RepID=UPI002E3796A1|nr:ABC transporter substrate-binding protein [Vineibacter terrae]HEX2889712.1 ABC transporter substrate-binding protein [Vineibacter terrae]
MRMRGLGRRLAAGVLALALGGGVAMAQAPAEKPQYGGTLEVGTMFYTLSALSWDPHDWNWKLNHDTGQFYEQLIVGDLDKSVRKGGKYPFTIDAFLPPGAQRGELAEKWELVQNPLSVVFTLRKGVMFPAKQGVMAERELTAEDVVFSFNRLRSSPKNISTYYDFVDRVEARDKHTVVYYFKEYNAEWDYRLAWGFYSVVTPKEVVDAGANNWRNVNGTGPFMLTDFVQGNSNTYTKNPIYWDKEMIGGQAYKIPFVDKVIYRTIKDEATMNAALRTAKVDMLESISVRHAPELKKSAPHLKWAKRLSVLGSFVALRTDTKPFDDVRVRRALNMAINKKEIIAAHYVGEAELHAYPMHPDWSGYFDPLDKLPPATQEMYVYDPKKAKKLLAEAGYPNGFSFKMQYCSCSPDDTELAPYLVAYLEQVGVKVELQPMEYAAFLSAMTTKKHAAGYLMRSSHTNPTTSLRKSFYSGQTWNPALYSDPKFDARMDEAYRTADEEKRMEILRELTAEIVAQAPYIWLPTPYTYAAWWPWVKNYGGELNVGSLRPGPIYARIWIDQEMKKKMGY